MHIRKLSFLLCLYLLGVIIAFWHLPHQPTYQEPLRTSGAMAALQRFAAQRAYPERSSPRSGFMTAFRDSRTRLAPVTAKSERSEPWTSLGPHNIGGRTLAVAFNPENPQTIWAGSASGGVWRSFTGGVGVAAWHQLTTGFPLLGVSSIAFAPNDSSTIYLGTGEVYSYDDTQGGLAVRLTRGSFGMGILKSSDGGASWSHSLDWSYEQQRGVQVVRVDPSDPLTVWAGTTEGTYKSTDAGASWQQIHDVIMVTDLVIHPLDPDIVVIACGNLNSAGRGLYRTTDGGAGWVPCGPAGLPTDYAGKAQLGLCRDFPDVIMASIGNGGLESNHTWLCRSEDAGATWQIVSQTDYARYQGWFSHDVAIHPGDPERVISAGINIWKSTQGGASLVEKSDWSAWYFGQTPPGGPEGPPYYSHADHHDVVYHPTDPDIVYFANDGGIFRSLDGGETFSGCNGGYQTQQFYPGFSCSQNDSQLALGGMQDNATAIYRGSDAWYRVIGGDGSWTGIDAMDNDVLYGSAQYLQMLKSTDGGNGWSWIQPPGSTLPTAFIAPYALGGIWSSEVIFAGRMVIYRSLDAGGDWDIMNSGAPLDSNPALTIAVSQQSHQNLYVTTAPVNTRAGVFRSTNAGGSFTNITGDLPDRYPIGLCIDPSDDATVYLTFGGFGTGHVYRSTNRGDDWQEIGQDLPDLPTSSVAVDPLYPQHVYVGNDLGVYLSTNSGASWSEWRDGLPDAVIAMDLKVSPSDRSLRVATHGNGVYSRPLHEPVTAVAEDEGLPPAAVSTQVQLAQNYPNPFNPATTIAYHLPQAGDVRLSVYSLAGRHIATLVDGWRAAGDHERVWAGRDQAGYQVPSGHYIYRLETRGVVRSRRMVLVQ